MKRIVLPLLMLVSCSSFLSGQNNDEQAVRKAFDTILAIFSSHNAEAAAPLLTDNFRLDGYGPAMNKEQRLASIKSGQFTYGPFKDENVKIVLSGNTATVRVNTPVKYNANGQDHSCTIWYFNFHKGKGAMATLR
jgi:hypothetical protein